MAYQHILLCTDFREGARQVAERAKRLAEQVDAKITILNVVEYSTINLGSDLTLPPQIDIESQLLQNARLQLTEFAKESGLTHAELRIEHGVTKSVIAKVAEELQVDLVVVGSHSRHGFAKFLGSTASAVVHSATRDVLAVRTTNPEQ